MQNSICEIETVRLKDDEIHAVIHVISPDSVFIAEKIMKDFDRSLGIEERQRVYNENAIEMLKAGNIPTVGNKVTMILIKENGQWKIDKPGLFND